MKGKIKKTAWLCLACGAFLFASGFQTADEAARGQGGYLKSATYYSDAWVVNFWNSESKDMEKELAAIAADGFNSIILAVPWREFQPGLYPVSYSGYAWEKLDQVMEAAKEAGLSVMLRVGYTWDYCGEGSVLGRYRQLLYDNTVYASWLEYVGRLYQAASAHENFCGGFLTWEDFWNFTSDATTFGNTDQGRLMAKRTGFASYVREHYSLEQVQELYGGTISSYEELYLPTKELPALRVFYEFYDQFLGQLLSDSSQVFPGLSMEVRLDGDVVYLEDGRAGGYSHSVTFPCGEAAYTCAMYGIPIGQENKGERLKAAQAIQGAVSILDGLLGSNGGKPVYLDQFLFTDNTPGFEHNAQLAEGELAGYLEGMAPVLEEKTMGYGVWTYRDYGDNRLYNAQFALGEEGWEFLEGTAEERNGTMQARLASGGSIFQDTSGRPAGGGGEDTWVEFSAFSEGVSDVTVCMGSHRMLATVSGEGRVKLCFEGIQPSALSIENQGAVLYVDDVQVYTHVSQGKLYDMSGEPLEGIQAVRTLNRLLDE